MMASNERAAPDPNAAKAEEPDAARGGEDEGSTEKNGDDRHLHDDQKSPKLGEP
jgi:hypothetical protein